MASKPLKNPIIQLKGFSCIADAIKVFPFDYVCTFFMLNNFKWDNKYPTIPQMIEIIHELYRTVKDKQNNGEYYFGRNYEMIPEVDGKVFFKSEKKIENGEIINVQIKSCTDYDLVGVVYDESCK